jgi:hypothetical protein
LRFGATAAGSADLKSSAEIPPLRQAAIPLEAMRGRHSTSTKCKKKLENLKILKNCVSLHFYYFLPKWI